MTTTEALNKTPTAATIATGPVTGFDAAHKHASESEKLELGWRWVTIPDKDPYDYVFKGIWLNGTGKDPDFAPGTHLVPPDVATALEERLLVFAKYNTRLMRPSADLTSLSQVPGAR
jgi:hypothetical protein